MVDAPTPQARHAQLLQYVPPEAATIMSAAKFDMQAFADFMRELDKQRLASLAAASDNRKQ